MVYWPLRETKLLQLGCESDNYRASSLVFIKLVLQWVDNFSYLVSTLKSCFCIIANSLLKNLPRGSSKLCVCGFYALEFLILSPLVLYMRRQLSVHSFSIIGYHSSLIKHGTVQLQFYS